MQKYEDEKHVFSEAEIMDLGNEVAEAVIRIQSLEDELKEKKANYKGRIEEQTLITKVNSRKISDGFELRSVPVTEKPNYKKKTMSMISDVTGKVLKTRTLTPDEMQLKL